MFRQFENYWKNCTKLFLLDSGSKQVSIAVSMGWKIQMAVSTVHEY